MNRRFTVEFPEPTREAVLDVACPFCKAFARNRCVTQRWRPSGEKVTSMSNFHHDRVAIACGLRVVYSSQVYSL